MSAGVDDNSAKEEADAIAAALSMRSFENLRKHLNIAISLKA